MPLIVKYIAEGFVQDAEKLIVDFEKENSPHFPSFARVWKIHNFAAVFLGRSSSELQQFTHEIFQLTLRYMESSALIRQIAAVYLLYALFRNQVLSPPTRIRVMLKQYQRFLELRQLAIEQDYKTLHYVIGFLLEHAFDCVANPTLVGPRNSRHKLEIEKKALQMSCMFSDLKKASSTLLGSNLLQDIQEISKAYSQLTKDIPFKNCTLKETDFNIETNMNNLSKLIVPKVREEAEANGQSEMQGDIGNRRAELKSKAFSSKAWFRQLNLTDDDDDNEDNIRFTRSRAQRQALSKTVAITKDLSDNQGDEEFKEKKVKRKRRKRVPKELRRIGRPRKDAQLEELLMEDEDSDVSTPKVAQKPGPKTRTTYFDGYIPKALRPAEVDITMLSDTSEEDDIKAEEAVESEEEVKPEEAVESEEVKSEEAVESEEEVKPEEAVESEDDALTF